MTTIDQSNRDLTIQIPQSEDLLAVRSFRGSERLGRLFQFELELISYENLDFNQIVGKPAFLELKLPDDKTRYFNGFVSQFIQAPGDQPFAFYHAVLRPWTWFLTLTSNCKVFQEATVPEIIQNIFDSHDFKDFDLKDLKKNDYQKRTYCVQYRETDFNFISRLMEEEGIYYYFKHSEKKHTLVFADEPNDHTEFPGYATVDYSVDAAQHHDKQLIFDWNLAQEVRPGHYSMADYNYTKSAADLKTKATQKREHDFADFKMYDFPGNYDEKKAGNRFADIRLQELQAAHRTSYARSNVRGIAVGSTYELSGFGRDKENTKYLVTSADYSIELDLPGSSGGGGRAFHCSFSNIPADTQFRPERVTPVPVIHGLQTAKVVGRKSDQQQADDAEIYTDKDGFACVKVKFHWDQAEEGDNSCWIRVAQPWAGNKWGAIFIPRIGQEVVVAFLEGNVDRPLIIGSVYNNLQRPPYDLPPNKTQSGIKTRSSRDGSTPNFNEIQFEDKKGEEKISIHAEKDFSESVEKDKSISVGGTHGETISGDTTISISKGKLKQTVVSSSAEIIVHTWVHLVSETQDVWIKAAKPVKIDSNGASTGTFKEDGSIIIDGSSSVRLQSGGNYIEIKSDGTITISAKKIAITGGEEAKLGVSNQNVTCDTAKTALAGAAINSSAVGMHEITGAVVKIN